MGTPIALLRWVRIAGHKSILLASLMAMTMAIAMTPAEAKRPAKKTKAHQPKRVDHRKQNAKAKPKAAAKTKLRTTKAKPRAASKASTTLKKLGFSRLVTEAILAKQPAIARRIIAAAKSQRRLPTKTGDFYAAGTSAGKSITIYRGIAAEKFSPAHFSKKRNGDTYASERLEKAIFYGARAPKDHGRFGLVVELQVPAFLLRVGNFGHPVFSKSDLRDFSAFISRVGIVSVGESNQKVKWQKPEATGDYIQYRKPKNAN